MGALPRIKAKKDYQYRKGSTNEYKNCSNCESLTKVTFNRNGAEIGEQRCKIFGLNESIRYRIHPDFTCNAQQPKPARYIP